MRAHTHVHTHTHTYTHLCAHRHTHAHVHTHTCAHTHTHTHTCTHTCAHTHAHTRVCTHTHAHTHTHVPIHAHTHTAKYIQRLRAQYLVCVCVCVCVCPCASVHVCECAECVYLTSITQCSLSSQQATECNAIPRTPYRRGQRPRTLYAASETSLPLLLPLRLYEGEKVSAHADTKLFIQSCRQPVCHGFQWPAACGRRGTGFTGLSRLSTAPPPPHPPRTPPHPPGHQEVMAV